ncbi:MAG TPA: 50S ribosomal protein L35 [Armatimonadetes bacterium]|nr:50S ribosomal protein L35 [Armatimonadota bacterium]
MARKMKTRKSVAKRFKVTGTGKLMRRRAGRSHLLRKKTSRRKRHLAKEVRVSGCDRQAITRQLGG